MNQPIADVQEMIDVKFSLISKLRLEYEEAMSAGDKQHARCILAEIKVVRDEAEALIDALGATRH